MVGLPEFIPPVGLQPFDPLFTARAPFDHALEGLQGVEVVAVDPTVPDAHALGDPGISTRTTLTYCDGSTLRHCYGELEGSIPPEPRGSNGFAWDTIFIPEGQERTFAEMTAEEKNAISMHRVALEELRAFLSG